MATATRARRSAPRAAATATDPATLAKKLSNVKRETADALVERSEEVELMILGMLARVHVLFIGEPGVAKSMTLRELHSHITGAEIFERLVFKQTPAEEILGPVSLKALERDSYERVTTRKLPEAHVAFIDEVFKANATILNAMLSIINERIFHNNGGAVTVPLWFAGFASNELPGLDRDDLRAFRDRIAVTKVVHDVRSDDSFKAVLRSQIARRAGTMGASVPTMVSLSEVEQAHRLIDEITVTEDVLDEFARLKSACSEANLKMNPRRFGEGVKLCQARAFLAGRPEVITDDLKVFQHVIWRDPEDEQSAYRIILDFASEYERAAARFQDEYDPIRQEFQGLKAKGTIDPNDSEGLQASIRVKRLLDVMDQKVTEKLEAARKDGRDTLTLEELQTSIRTDRGWINKEAFGIDT